MSLCTVYCYSTQCTDKKYPGRESNPHDRNDHRILSPACLPVPPPGQNPVSVNRVSEQRQTLLFTNTHTDTQFFHQRIIKLTNKKRKSANKKLPQRERVWSGRPGSNRPPRPWQGRALPNELLPPVNLKI